MKPTAFIAWREFCAMFRLPVGWVVMALYLLLAGAVFAFGALEPGSAASLRDFFGLSGVLLVPVAPAISMRLVSEERRAGTLEVLASAPIGPVAVAAGKYLGAVAFLAVMLLPTLVYPLVLAAVADPRPDVGPIAAGYLALMLLGALYLAVGLVASALTTSQTLAYLATFLALVAVVVVPTVAAGSGPAWVGRLAAQVSMARRLDELARGVIDLRQLVFFLTTTIWFLALAVVVLSWRHWASLWHAALGPPRSQPGHGPARFRPAHALPIAVLVLLAVLVVAAQLVAARADLRWDVTAGRDHLLAPRTLRLLEAIDAPHDVIIVADPSRHEPRVLRRVRDVLDALERAQPKLRCTMINPATGPGSGELARVVTRLLERESAAFTAAIAGIERIAAESESLAQWLQAELIKALEQAAEAASVRPDAQAQRWRDAATAMRLRQRELLDAAGAARGALGATYLAAVPALDRAVAALRAPLAAAADELAHLALLADSAAAASDQHLADTFVTLARQVQTWRDRAAIAEHELAALPAPELVRVARMLEATEAALVIGPPAPGVAASRAGLTAIDIDALFWTGPLDEQGAGLEADPGRRAEQLLATALATLADPAQPIVVLVHAERGRGVTTTPALAGLVAALELRGATVLEWPAALDPDPPPLAPADPTGRRPAVYVIVGTDSAVVAGDTPGLTGPERVAALGAATQRLIDAGQSLLIAISPSTLPAYGQEDPAAQPLAQFGLRIDSGRPILRERFTPAGRVVDTDQLVHVTDSDHPLASALSGLPILLPWPVPIELLNHPPEDVVIQPLAFIPGERCWAESQWFGYSRVPRAQRHLVADAPGFDPGRDSRADAWIVAAATQRPAPAGTGPVPWQRLVVVGSNGWFLDAVAQRREVIDGRAVLAWPGNLELFESAVWFLAGKDAQLGAGPSARATPLVRPVPHATLTLIRWLLIAGLPLAVLTIGAVGLWRHR